jgi:HEAT repeat protein
VKSRRIASVAGLAVAVLAAATSSSFAADHVRAVAVAAPSDTAARDVERAVVADDLEALKAMGPSVMPRLARLYRAGDEGQRQRLANVFYRLGWKSEEAKDALMKDIHTPSQGLRLSVQWALGRVSNDVSVVDVLLDNMQNDAQLLFRDKAACALANDQIHLTSAQKVHLYEGLIRALDDPKVDVRRIAALVLQIQTGQDKGFRFGDPPDARARAAEAWRQWLAEYRSQL